MKPITAVCASALSALGRGERAYAAGAIGDAHASALALRSEWAGSLRHPLVGRVALESDREEDRATIFLQTVLADLVDGLDRVAPGWRGARIALVLGTSSGPMTSIQRGLLERARGELSPQAAAGASYLAPLDGLERILGAPATVVQVLAACASSTMAIGLGCRWLEAGLFDWVIAGGYDALSALVASGFDSLVALTRSEPRPFRADRDGMALGEGAALVALHADEGHPGFGRVLGFGASSDAVHITAPDATGAGLAGAGLAALEDAGVPPARIDLVSVHATATPFNDAAEARALRRLFGDRVVPIFPLKGVIGHTLGAAGVLESLATWDALRRGILPAVGGSGSLCEEARVWLPDVHTERPLAVALKISAAFGGANAALVLGAAGASTPGSRRPQRPVGLAALGPFVVGPEPELVSRLSRAPESALSRLDGLSELTVAASARLLASLGSSPGARTAVVVGTQSATLEANDLFDRRRRDGHAVEPRRFPATSPNLCAGWCSIAFGWTGPSLSVGSADAASEAMRIGYDLVAAGDAEAAVVVAAEDAGPAVRELSLTAGRPVPPRGAQALLLVPTAESGDPGRARLVWPGLGPARTAGR